MTVQSGNRTKTGLTDPQLHDNFTCETQLLGPKTGSFNSIVNCTFEYCDGGAIRLSGKYDRIENILAHDLDWSGVENPTSSLFTDKVNKRIY